MRIVVLTSVDAGLASRCVPQLVSSSYAELVGVVHALGKPPGRARRVRRILAKVAHIGVGGALNGVRIRPWFEDTQALPIMEACRRFQVPLFEVPWINSIETESQLDALAPDLMLSLGNDYIAERIYSKPVHGTLNVHCECLPDYQNAQSVIWPIHQGESRTGITLHRVERQIDTGAILHQATFPICFDGSLEATVRRTVALTYARVPDLVVETVERFDELSASARPQSGGGHFTTPTLKQFLRMLRQHRRLSMEKVR